MSIPQGPAASSSRIDESDIRPEELGELIRDAYHRLHGRVVHTPTIPLHWMAKPSQEIWAKLECHQHTGSFKFRGALNAVELSSAQTVITASAGNHALAICRAAKTLGKESTIIAPLNISEIKSKRIKNDATHLVFYGNDLAEATKEAIRIEKEGQGNVSHDTAMARQPEYISPFDNISVAAGAGTLMFEAIQDTGDFDYVIVPLGGGGLAAAVASWCSVHSPSTKVICVHPQVFGRALGGERGRLSQSLRKPTEPTLCDGLAVQLVRDTPFAYILDTLIDEVAEVPEKSVQEAISQALRFQSLLLEGSSAATIALLNDGPDSIKHLKGKVLLLLTGGNISSSNVARSIVTHVIHPDMRQKLGLRGIINPSAIGGTLDKLAVANHYQEGLSSPTGPMLSWTNDAMSGRTYQKPRDLVAALMDSFGTSMENLLRTVHQRRQLSSYLGLETDQWSEAILSGLIEQLQNLATEFTGTLSQDSTPFWILEERYRVLLQLYSAASSLMRRVAASNDQSTREWFHKTVLQDQSLCNYDRYGDNDLRAAELMALRALRPARSAPVSLLLTSSGMAAFQVVLQYLLQRLKPGDTIVMPPYIYFEANEQLSSYQHLFHICSASSFDPVDIIREAEKRNARAVFVDPVANIVGLPATDIRAFLRQVSIRPGWEKKIVIVDGTMISGGLRVFDWAQGPHAPTLLSHESASKYLQLGLDLQMAGLVICSSDLDGRLRKIRRDTGTVMMGRSLSLLPNLTFELYRSRLLMLTSTAELLFEGLSKHISHIARVSFPAEWRRYGWEHGGGLVTVEFLDSGLNNKEGLDSCIELVLRASAKEGLPITKGVSFGFSTSRISASSSMAENSDPFLRISVGIHEQEVQTLTKVLTTSVLEYSFVYSLEE
ncbi:tryptophan synthase beta subunit-like PLP-dependent enzyme [Aspergillus ambiguus]|uniref:tryptophan synthase beta subunit-like PLP-dependent enzyme n=1 Tax=Aspergillus ambiguus TaxID=176160 RepID=UPI003CCD64D1